jgi:hypothetical protein
VGGLAHGIRLRLPRALGKRLSSAKKPRGGIRPKSGDNSRLAGRSRIRDSVPTRAASR